MAASLRTSVRLSSILIKSFKTNLSRNKGPMRNWMGVHNVCSYHRRFFSVSFNLCNDNHEVPASEIKKMMESLTDKFSEARELMDDARESKGTVYFSDDMKEAQQAVEETLTEYKLLLEKLSDKQRQDVVSSLGLRMEELKAQQAAMEEEVKHD